MKKVALAIMAICIIANLGIATAQAAYTSSVANITGVGNGLDISYVALTDTKGTFTNKWFILDTTNAKTLLATALTAVSMGSSVVVKYDPALATPVIISLYLNNGFQQ